MCNINMNETLTDWLTRCIQRYWCTIHRWPITRYVRELQRTWIITIHVIVNNTSLAHPITKLYVHLLNVLYVLRPSEPQKQSCLSHYARSRSDSMQLCNGHYGAPNLFQHVYDVLIYVCTLLFIHCKQDIEIYVPWCFRRKIFYNKRIYRLLADLGPIDEWPFISYSKYSSLIILTYAVSCKLNFSLILEKPFIWWTTKLTHMRLIFIDQVKSWFGRLTWILNFRR
jgi:hypothetical protein